MTNASPTTACVLIIGNEILSGKTQDKNLQFLGAELSRRGVRLEEARVLPDDKAEIIATLNACRAKYKYVITTGGIGPTHDDITAECVASAFKRDLILHDDAVELLRRSGRELNPARLKMAHVPKGSVLIDNPISNAPGFRIENVFVLAGIPSVARAMFSNFADQLGAGGSIYSRNVDVFLPEGDIAKPLGSIAAKHSDVEIGSYPFSRDSRYGANLVVRGPNESLVEEIFGLVITAMQDLGGEVHVGESSS
jgi:molybdenum cofactor synthesis domain-containing protein